MSKYSIKGDTDFHLSVGAVIYDEDNNILCHRFDNMFGAKNLHILMRETLEDDETLEQAVIRGSKEEFGAEIMIAAFLGGRITTAYTKDLNQTFNKTTVYFLCRLTLFETNKRSCGDEERGSQIIRLSPKDLILIMKEQFNMHKIDDLDESSIIERAEQVKNNHG